MSWLANCCYVIAGLLYLPVLLYQMIVQGKNRHGWRQRFGHVPSRAGDAPCMWIHAVSLGEINATRQLVDQLRATHEALDIVISTTTDTGYARARQLYPELMIFRFPLDFSWVIQRVFQRVRPSMIVLVELEVWYNLVTLAAARDIAVCVVNGRLTARSRRRFSLVRPVVRPMFAGLRWVGAQTADIADRFVFLGTSSASVRVTGSLKWDTATVAETVSGDDALATEMRIDRSVPLIVLGSSGPGEEQQVLAAWRAQSGDNPSILVIVPRKPERFDEVARLLERGGDTVLRRSQAGPSSDSAAPAAASRLILGDTMGELRKFYSLADLVIVGRTLVPLGGSDPMEVAALSKPIIVGPHTENFAEPIERLKTAGAVHIVQDQHELGEALRNLLAEPATCAAMGRRGQQVVRDNQGATARTVDYLLALMGNRTQRGV